MKHSILGVELNLEMIVKLCALIFALGILYGKIGNAEDVFSERMSRTEDVLRSEISGIKYRLERVENKIDRREQ